MKANTIIFVFAVICLFFVASAQQLEKGKQEVQSQVERTIEGGKKIEISEKKDEKQADTQQKKTEVKADNKQQKEEKKEEKKQEKIEKKEEKKQEKIEKKEEKKQQKIEKKEEKKQNKGQEQKGQKKWDNKVVSDNQKLKKNEAMGNLTFGEKTNYTGVFYKACNKSEPTTYTLRKRQINLCPKNVGENTTSSFIFAVVSAFASAGRPCSNSTVCTPQGLIGELNKTVGTNLNILSLRRCQHVLKKKGNFNVQHNGNLFKNYFILITLAQKVEVKRGSRTFSRLVRIQYLVKEFKKDGTAVVHNPFGENFEVKSNSKDIRRVQAFRWVKDLPLPGVFRGLPRRV